MHPLFIEMSRIADGVWPEAEELMVIGRQKNERSGFGDKPWALAAVSSEILAESISIQSRSPQDAQNESIARPQRASARVVASLEAFKTTVQQGRSERKAEAYSEYVETSERCENDAGG